MATINGTSGNDNLTGTSGDDTILGGDGNDTLSGGAGNDSLDGGNGNDFLQGDAGNDTIIGGAGTDTAAYGSATSGVVVNLATGTASDGLGGTDTLSGIENVNGSAFADKLTGDANNNNFYGGAGNDTIDGGAGIDGIDFYGAASGINVDLAAGSGTDGDGGTDTYISIESVFASQFADKIKMSDTGGGYVTGRAGNDTITGGASNDSINPGSGNDSVDGGAGTDFLDYMPDPGDSAGTPTQGVTINLATGTATDAWGGTDTVVNFENAGGSNLADKITGNDGNNFLDGRGGDDSIDGGAGDDGLMGGAGNDTLNGGANGSFGDTAQYNSGLATTGVTVDLAAGTATDGQGGTDTLVGIENVYGTAFADVLKGADGVDNRFLPGAGNDTVDGRGGNDEVMYWDSTAGVTVDLKAGTASGSTIGNDTLISIERVTGSNFDDKLTLSDSDGSVLGRAGNDSITGGAGNDFLWGGSGNDTIDGGAGIDTVEYRDDGFDGSTVSTIGVTVNLATGTATDNWGNTDTLRNVENVNGSEFADTITGDANSNVLFGRGGNDSIDGGAGNDFLNGGAGNDTLNGGDGVDRVSFFGATSGVVVNLATGTASDGLGGTDTLISIENVSGTQFADTITGDAGPNSINGNAGDDVISAGAGQDTVVGGAGNDTLDGGAITDRVNYTDLNILRFDGATAAVNVNFETGVVSDGQGGTDQVSNFNFVVGTQFNDVLTGSSTQVNLFEQFEGGPGNDTIDGGAINAANSFSSNRVTYQNASGAVQVDLGLGSATGADGNDTLININQVRGSNFDDTLIGSDTTAYVESFEGRAGNDTIDGKGGIDLVRYDFAPAAVVVNLATLSAQDGYGTVDTLRNIENVRGSEFNDSLTGDAGNNTLDGRGGNDTIDGGAGNDLLTGGDGNDSLLGGAGQDTLNGGAGNDTLDGGTVTDLVDYTDANWVSYTGATGGVVVNLATGTASDGMGGTDTLANFNFVNGSAFDDKITGSTNGQFEMFQPGAGNDTVDGGDIVTGGSNRISYNDATAAVTVNLGTGTATGGSGNDTLVNINQVRGSAFDDTLIGSDATTYTERFEGKAGNDTIDGKGGIDEVDYRFDPAGVTVDLAAGTAKDGYGGTDTLLNIENIRASDFADVLTGSAGNNRIDGRAGNDTITGGAGDDTLIGGSGNDVFVFAANGNGVDTINDFQLGDTIKVAATLGGLTAGDGSNVGAKGVQLASSGGVTTLSFDTDGTAGAADLQIKLNGVFGVSDLQLTGNGDGTTSISIAPPPPAPAPAPAPATSTAPAPAPAPATALTQVTSPTSTTISSDSLVVVNQVLTDVVSSTLKSATIGSTTLLVAQDTSGTTKGVLVPSNSAVSGTVNDGGLTMTVNLPANKGVAFEGRDNVAPAVATSFLNQVISVYVPDAPAGSAQAAERASLQSAVGHVVDSLAASGVQNVTVRVVHFVNGRPTVSSAAGDDTQALRAPQGDIVFDAGTGTGKELFTADLRGLSSSDTLVLRNVEGAVLAGAGTVRVDSAAGVRVAGDLASQTITGGAGNDLLVGGGGNDVLTGGGGADIFGITALGNYTITDFNRTAGDKIAFKAGGITSIAQLAPLVSGVVDNAEGITFSFLGGAASIKLVGLHAADIAGDMVQFGF